MQDNGQKTSEDKNKKEKEKKPKLALGKVLSDNVFVLKMVHRAAPWYMPTYFGWSVFGSIVNFLSGSYLLRLVINHLQASKSLTAVLIYIGIIFGLNVLYRIVIGWISNKLYPRYNMRIVEEFQRVLFDKARAVELSCYEDPAFYDKYVKVMDTAYNRSMNVIYALDRLIWNGVSFFANAALLYIIDPWFVVFGLFPLVLGLLNKRAEKLQHKLKTDSTPYERREAYVRRAFYQSDYAKEMRLSGMKRQLFRFRDESFRDRLRVLRAYSLRRVPVGYALDIGVEVVTVLGAMLYAAWRTLSDTTDPMRIGDCIVVFNSVSMIAWTLSDLIANLAEFHANALYIEDFRYFLNYKPKIDQKADGLMANGGVLECRNVSFSYKGADKPSLCDVNLTIRPGEKIALVGCNGSGKTTLVKLLLHLYEPTEGQILLNGIDAKEYSLESFREQFGVVFQDLKTFSMSVAENVLMRPLREGDEERVIEALKQSGGWEKVQSLPRGIHTTLTREFDDEGAQLSGGETQKIALARIFADPSPIVILDEPSSALDPIAEYTMFGNMLRACQGRTLIFISHRLSSAVLADRVILLDGGRIVETGTHEELMANDGPYADMFRKQAENYVDVSVPGEVEA